MIITRASRRDADEIKQFYASQEWGKVDVGEGLTFIARQGPIAGCVRVIEINPQKIVLEDLVVHRDHRGTGVGGDLVRAAMNARGGTIYAPTTDDAVGFYERLGFKEIGWDDLPDPVKKRMHATANVPGIPGALERYMKAR